VIARIEEGRVMALPTFKGMLRVTGWTLTAGLFVAFMLSTVRSNRVDKSPPVASSVADQAPIAGFTRPPPEPDNTIQFDPDMRRKHQVGDQAVAMTRPCMRQAALARLQAGERDRKRLEQFVVQTCAVPIRQTMASLNEPGAEELLKILASVEVENAIVLGR
jgi:hypothetical protein